MVDLYRVYHSPASDYSVALKKLVDLSTRFEKEWDLHSSCEQFHGVEMNFEIS